MALTNDFDELAGHRFFSAACFNRAWDLIEKPDRTADEDEAMLQLGMASMWHWSQRPDHTAKNISISAWQVSRIYSLLSQPENARRYGRMCLEASQTPGVSPFYLGYAYEALARAEAFAGDREQMEAYLKQAHKVADTLNEPDSKQQLLDDLATIRLRKGKR